MSAVMQSPGPWRESANGAYWRNGEQFCEFVHNGQRYNVYRDRDGKILHVSKRERTNARGVHYHRLAAGGKAERDVLKAFTEVRP